MNEDEDIVRLKGYILAQSGLVSGLLVALVRKQLFSVHEVREIYENVLLNLEQNQMILEPGDQRIFEQARSTLEAALRSLEDLRKAGNAN